MTFTALSRRTVSPALTFDGWIAALAARGIDVLPPSHAVPIELWARDDRGLLHFTARGTTVRLRRYHERDLTRLILRAECDCEEHRTAGATGRTVLRPGATPLGEAVVAGAEEFGWTGVAAGLLGVSAAAELFDRLLGELAQPATGDELAEAAVA